MDTNATDTDTVMATVLVTGIATVMVTDMENRIRSTIKNVRSGVGGYSIRQQNIIIMAESREVFIQLLGILLVSGYGVLFLYNHGIPKHSCDTSFSYTSSFSYAFVPKKSHNKTSITAMVTLMIFFFRLLFINTLR